MASWAVAAVALAAVFGGENPLRIALADRLDVDGANVAYVAEPDRHRVVALDPGGHAVRVWRAGSFRFTPVDAAVAPDGSVWALDTAADRVRPLGPDGSIGEGFGVDGRASALDAAPDGTLLVAVPPASEVIRFDGNGLRLGSWTTPRFTLPIDVAGLPDGRIAVALGDYEPPSSDVVNGSLEQGLALFSAAGERERLVECECYRPFVAAGGNEIFLRAGDEVRVFALDGTERRRIALPRARALAAGPAGGFSVLREQRIESYDSDGASVSTRADRPDAPGVLNAPDGVAAGPRGRVYVADAHGVQVFGAAGGHVRSLAVDGARPSAVAVARDGTVLAKVGERLVAWPHRGGAAQPLERSASALTARGNRFYAAAFDRVEVLDTSGRVRRAVELGRQCDEPCLPHARPHITGVAVLRDGSFVLSERRRYLIPGGYHGADQLLTYSPRGDLLATVALDAGPSGVATHRDGTLSVALGDGRLLSLTRTGRVLGTRGGEGSARGRFLSPTGVAAVPGRRCLAFVADMGNERVQRLRCPR